MVMNNNLASTRADMNWKFERVAGPFKGALGGVAWDGTGVLVSLIDEMQIKKFNPLTGNTTDYRNYTGRTNGLAVAPDGVVYAAQEGGRRVVALLPDGSTVVTATRFEGKPHNHPCDLVLDKKGRIWFTDPRQGIQAFGPKMFPLLDHASVMRIERDDRNHWVIRRVTYDTTDPRSVLLSPDEKTLYVSENGSGSASSPDSPARELRAYALRADGSTGPYTVLHTFDRDHRGPQRGIEGMCLDAEGNIVAVAGSNASGPGPLVYVFAPSGRVLETHALPCDAPVRCAFGDAGLDGLYVSGGDGFLYRAEGILRGARRRV